MHKDTYVNKLKMLTMFLFMVIGLLVLAGCAAAENEEEHDDDDDEEEWGDYSAAEIVGIGIFILILMIVAIWVGLWIYHDAEKRGLDGTSWLIVLFVGNIVGLIIYYFIRKENPVVGKTPTGDTPAPAQAKSIEHE